MLKSFRKSLLSVLRGILTDVAQSYPALAAGCDRDFARIRSSVDARGLGVLTLELPALCKHLDKCIDNGLWTEPFTPLSRRSGPASPCPRLFGGMWLRLFDKKGMLRDQVDTHAYQLLRQLLLFAKKVRLECKDTAVYAAVASFYEIEEEIPQPTLPWNGRDFDGSTAKFLSLAEPPGFYPERGELPLLIGIEPRRSSLLQLIQSVADQLACVLGAFNAFDHKPKHGPGVVSDLKGGEFKYTFPSWPNRLERVFPLADFAYANVGLWADSVEEADHSDIEPSSRLIVVPKTQKAPRLIAAEPTAHQWCQQVIWSYFKTAYTNRPIVKGVTLDDFVSFGDQTGNQKLARLGSVNGAYVTVDLSSASDRLSCFVVERIFRRNPALLEAFYASRTRYLSQDIDKRCPKIVRLKKFSTMGSACTFPVQSHVFLCVALACTLYARGDKVTPRTIAALAGQVRVFGDDIIVPRVAGALLLEALGSLGLKVNQEKTYRNGRFRESCGLEAFAGDVVTPAYFLRPPTRTNPESVVSAVACRNNFFLKGMWHAAAAIERTVPQEFNFPVVEPSSGQLGWISFCGSDVSHLKTRWNKGLQRVETQVTVLSTESARKSPSHWGQLLQYFTEAPASDLFWTSGVADRPRCKLSRGWVSAAELGVILPRVGERG